MMPNHLPASRADHAFRRRSPAVLRTLGAGLAGAALVTTAALIFAPATDGSHGPQPTAQTQAQESIVIPADPSNTDRFPQGTVSGSSAQSFWPTDPDAPEGGAAGSPGDQQDGTTTPGTGTEPAGSAQRPAGSGGSSSNPGPGSAGDDPGTTGPGPKPAPKPDPGPGENPDPAPKAPDVPVEVPKPGPKPDPKPKPDPTDECTVNLLGICIL